VLRSAVAAGLVLVLTAGCTPSGAARDQTAAAIARRARLDPLVVAGDHFDLQLYRRMGEGPLFVYIEGDGFAFLDTRTPSSDPTPVEPLALELAAADPGPAVLYIGRPCQFAPGRSDRRCAVADWTGARFSPDAILAVDEAIDSVVGHDSRRPLVLIGHSGGGVVAASIAERRSDVALLITLAAPLDLDAWTTRMRLSPLSGSLSPLDTRANLAHTPQIHFAGAEDAIVPADVTRSGAERLMSRESGRMIVIPEFDHRCCWVRDWPALRGEALHAAAVAP
jgi:hypothetical protein